MPVGALDDVQPNARREEFVAEDAIDHGVDLALREPIDGEGGDVWPSDPGRFKLRPERHDQQQRRVGTSSTIRPNSSRLVGSIDWASSRTISTGLDRDSLSTCDVISASSVF